VVVYGLPAIKARRFAFDRFARSDLASSCNEIANCGACKRKEPEMIVNESKRRTHRVCAVRKNRWGTSP
jgi:hypothetical protein